MLWHESARSYTTQLHQCELWSNVICLTGDNFYPKKYLQEVKWRHRPTQGRHLLYDAQNHMIKYAPFYSSFLEAYLRFTVLQDTGWIYNIRCQSRALRSHKSKLQLNVNIFNNIATQLEIFQALLQMKTRNFVRDIHIHCISARFLCPFQFFWTVTLITFVFEIDIQNTHTNLYLSKENNNNTDPAHTSSKIVYNYGFILVCKISFHS